MPYFDFSVIKKQTNTNHKKAKQYTILKRDIYGVVHITITGMLFVNINNTIIVITNAINVIPFTSSILKFIKTFSFHLYVVHIFLCI